MVLYLKFAYGSWFSGEKNDLKILHLVAEILGKTQSHFFGPKIFWKLENFILQKILVPKKMWSKKIWVQKDLGLKKFVPKNFIKKIRKNKV